MSSLARIILLTVGLFSLSELPSVVAASAPDVKPSGQTADSIREVLRTVARRQMHRYGPLRDGDYTPVGTVAELTASRKPAGVAWTYPWGVTLFGAIRSVDATGDLQALEWVLEQNRILSQFYVWAEHARIHSGNTEAWNELIKTDRTLSIARLLRLGDLDSCGAMGTEILEAALRHRERITPEERAVLERIANWITREQERLPDRTLWRKAQTDEDHVWPEGTIWADDLYMACPFLVRWAQFTGDGKFLTDAANQVIHMAARLQDADGLWFHAYSIPRKERSPFKWGRANGWIAVTMAEVLTALPENHPNRAAVLEICRRQMNGLKTVQADSGLWRQVLDRPELWEETSCTAMFAYALARGVNRGWLPASDLDVAKKAFAALCARCITPEGVIKGTCQGTGIGLRLDYYANRQRPDDDSHGPGVILLAGTELLNPGERANRR